MLLVGRNADAVILNFKQQIIFQFFNIDFDNSFSLAVADGIINQSVNYWVNLERIKIGRGQIFFNFKINVAIGGLAPILVFSDNLFG